jgi:hypothetical protein
MQFVDEFTIPISIIQYVIHNDMVRAFSIFLYMKSICDGVLSEKNLSFSELGETVGIKDRRTIQKYLKQLLAINWIGYNKISGNYFVRGFQYVKNAQGLISKTGVRIDRNRLKTLKSQLYAGLISFRLRGLKTAQRMFLKKKVGPSALQKHGALQKVMAYYNLRQYFGLSNTQLAELFKCSKSEANRIKMACIKDGLLLAKRQFKLLAVLPSPDYLFKQTFIHPNRIRVTGNRKSGIKIYEQLTDELIPMVYCTKMRA